MALDQPQSPGGESLFLIIDARQEDAPFIETSWSLSMSEIKNLGEDPKAFLFQAAMAKRA